MEYYVYQLIDSRTNKVFYIGKGQKKRMYQHVKDVQRGRIPNSSNRKLGNKIKKILDSENKIIYKKVFITEKRQEALNKEKKLIKEIGLKNLCNLTSGGEGCSLKGRIPWNKGKSGIYSEETRKKMSDSKKGIPRSEETKKKISEYRIGRKHTDETKRKISKNHSKYWLGKSRIKHEN